MIGFFLEQIRRILQLGNGGTTTCVPYGSGQLVIGLNSLFSFAEDEQNRWEGTTHPVEGAAVILEGVRAVSDAYGRAVIDLTTLCDGPHPITVTPPEGWDSVVPAGPLLGIGRSGDDMPPRAYRTISGTLVLLNREVVADESSFNGRHARIFRGTDAAATEGADVVIDWRPDYVKCHAERREPRTQGLNLAVLHRTGNNTTAIGATLSSYFNAVNPDDDAGPTSAHYVVDRDGFAVKMVHEAEVSYHAGWSYWGGAINLNQTSVGIEVVAAAVGPDYNDTEAEQYTQAQLETLSRLVGAIMAYGSFSRHRVVGHADINGFAGDNYMLGGVRIDCPGFTVRWDWLADAGVGAKSAVTDANRTAIDQRVSAKYHGFFDVDGRRLLFTDYDHDTTPHYSSQDMPTLAGTNLIRTLATDLSNIGYSVSASYEAGREGNGWHNGQRLPRRYRANNEQEPTDAQSGLEGAVDMFQRHFMRRGDAQHRFYFTKDVAQAIEAVLMDMGL